MAEWDVVKQEPVPTPIKANVKPLDPWAVQGTEPVAAQSRFSEPLAVRGDILPIGRTVSGKLVPAVPGAIKDPFDLFHEAISGKTPMVADEEGNVRPDAASISRAINAGMFGLKMGRLPAGELPKPAEIAAPEKAVPAKTGFEVAQEIPMPKLGVTAAVSPEMLEKQGKLPEPSPSAPKPSSGIIDGLKGAAKVVENVLSPTTAGVEGGKAEAAIRSAGGTAARDTEITRAAFEAHLPEIAKLDTQGKLKFIDFVENRSKGVTLDNPALEPVADVLRNAMAERRAKLEEMPSTAQAQFIEDYYPHLWKDAKKAQDFMAGGRTAKEGTGRFLKSRTIPTVADGIKAGLEPATLDPIETSMRYIQNMDRFIATNHVIDEARKMGTVKYFTPGKAPSGWVELNGRLGTKQTEAGLMKAYAPEDWSRVYNNFISRGFHANADAGKIYDTVRNASNAITSLELGLSGFHAFTMANEAIISSVAKGIGQLFGGSPGKALRSVGEAPAKPVTNYLMGKKVEQTYLGRNSAASEEMRKIVNLLEAAGGRAKGRTYAPDYSYTAMGSYWDSFKRGALKAEASDAWKSMKSSPVIGTARVALSQIGRIMQTVAQPLFEKYIPRIKNGAFYDTMQAWLEANPHASHEEQVATARKVWDSIDNRFGEMVQDNIFWNKTLKQTSQLGLRSYSWSLGTDREIGGGIKDTIMNPKSMSIKNPNWSPRANYIVALPILVGTINAVYQYLKTGKAPENVHDLLAGRTGGTAPGVQGDEVEERVQIPGYQKDVLGWYEDWWQEAKNKRSTAVSSFFNVLGNSDWRGDPILNPESSAPEWMKQYFEYAKQTFGPMSIKQMLQGEKTGSNISIPEQLMGLRPASAPLQDPEGYKTMKHNMNVKAQGKKRYHDIKKQMQYGGTGE